MADFQVRHRPNRRTWKSVIRLNQQIASARRLTIAFYSMTNVGVLITITVSQYLSLNFESTGNNLPDIAFHRLLIAAVLVLYAGCGDARKTTSKAPVLEAVPPPVAVVAVEPAVPDLVSIEGLRPQVEAFCGDCHVMPRPQSFVKQDWPREVGQGYMLYRVSGRVDLQIPKQDDVVRYYVEQAPDRLQMPPSITGNPPSRVRFQPLEITRQPTLNDARRVPCVSHLTWADIGFGSGPAIFYCDLGTGSLNAYWPGSDAPSIKRIASLRQPVHLEPCDLDNDGNQDWVVADLGEFMAADSDLGSVIWLRRVPNKDEFENVVLAAGLGRVADVRPGDFDADGDTDLIVAEFGWRKTGKIFMLVNQGLQANEKPKFIRQDIDNRHGAIHLPTVDLNGDGRLDFVALISQEFEAVAAFINNGQGGFDTINIWAAPDPTYGSSGIKLVDVDNDGDMDVLYCNGDSFDHGPKPYHSVQWLENQGEFPFVHHPISELPGVLAVDAGDYDDDGDIDFVAAALLPPLINQELSKTGVESLVLFEQVSPGQFQRTWIEQSQCHHGSIASGDFDGDGKVDLAVSNFFRDNETGQPDFLIWWNKGSTGK